MASNTSPTENFEQLSLIAELQRRRPGLLMEINPAAGMLLDKRMASRVKALGYQKGTLDIFLPELHCYIELKRIKGGRLTPEQAERIPKLEAAGYTVIVAKGAVDAIDKLVLHGLI